MRTCIVLVLMCVCITACNRTVSTQMSETPSTSAPVPASTSTYAVTSTSMTLSQRHVSSRLPVEFDYPDGWAVEEYQGENHVYVKWILVSDRGAFFSDPLNPENAGILINMITWSKIVSLDEALMTLEPSTLTRVTPDPVRVADTMFFIAFGPMVIVLELDVPLIWTYHRVLC